MSRAVIPELTPQLSLLIRLHTLARARELCASTETAGAARAGQSRTSGWFAVKRARGGGCALQRDTKGSLFIYTKHERSVTVPPPEPSGAPRRLISSGWNTGLIPDQMGMGHTHAHRHHASLHRCTLNCTRRCSRIRRCTQKGTETPLTTY